MRSTSGQKCRPATERPRTWDRNQPDLGQKPAGPATQRPWTGDGKENRSHTATQRPWTGDGKENRSHTRAQQAWTSDGKKNRFHTGAQRPWTGDGNSRTRNNIVWAPEEQHRSPGWQGTAGPGTERNSTRDRAESYQRRDRSRTRDRAEYQRRDRSRTRDRAESYQRRNGDIHKKNVVFEEKKKTDNRPPGCVDGRNGGRFLWK